MLVKVLLFARLRDIAGRAELDRELPDGATAQAAWDSLATEFGELHEYHRSVSVAVNQEYASFSTSLKNGDEVAFLPPVSGG